MNKHAMEYLKQMQQSIDAMTECIQGYAKHIPDFPVEPAYIATSMGHAPWVVFPFDRKLMQTLRHFMVQEGWELAWELKETEIRGNDYPRQSWRKKDVNPVYPRTAEITLAFQDNQPGSVCKRKQIGIKTVEQPVYEFVCAEAADGN